MKPLAISALVLLYCLASESIADGPADNRSDTVRPIPPLGQPLSPEQSLQLSERCAKLRSDWADVLAASDGKLRTAKQWEKQRYHSEAQNRHSLTPEILVFPRAVELALEFQQFYKERDVTVANELLDEADRRLEIATEDPNWSTVVGIQDGHDQQLIVGGYTSKIDKSYQPYAVVLPSGLTHGDSRPRRLDVWFHGRGETLSEVAFLAKGRTSPGQYTPDDTIVLHPYGRYSNAFKFAGEVDVLEALDHVKKNLPVDDLRTSVRGFSMGGAACWQFATHYADRFFAANPGAGFSETPAFLKSFQGEDLSSTPDYQRTLWRLYDCPPWSRNLVHCPTVAYSGEIDRQKQAADVMQQALAQHDIQMVHVIGPQTAHKIHEDSKVEIEARMDSLARTVTPSVPRTIDFTTQTLRYHRMYWVDVQGLQKHWNDARVNARIETKDAQTSLIATTENVTHLTFDFAAGQWPGAFPCRPNISIDGSTFAGTPVQSDRSWHFKCVLTDGVWSPQESDNMPIRKRPGVQGPIDDAFMDSFLFVTPSAVSSDPKFQSWAKGELKHARLHWRKHFRGDVHAIADHDLTKDHIANHNLILFGDPESNSAIARLADALPIQWTKDTITLGKTSFPRKSHAAIAIYPNPLNPSRYIVVNSGFTFREYDYLNNARQVPKLPDWAIVDISDGSTMRDPGKIKAAGFFDEQWNP